MELTKKQKQSLAVAKYRAKHPEKYYKTSRISSALYRATHPEKVKASQKKVRETHYYPHPRKKIYTILESVRNNHVPFKNEDLRKEIIILKEEINKIQMKLDNGSISY